MIMFCRVLKVAIQARDTRKLDFNILFAYVDV